MNRSLRSLIIPAVIVGMALVAVAVIYFVDAEHSLPSFFPGHAAHGRGHHHIRGYVAIAVGIILVIIAALAGRSRLSAY